MEGGTTLAGQGQAKTGPVGQSRVAITIARMSVTVRVPTTLRPLTGGASEVVVEAETVGEVLDSVDETHPGFRDRTRRRRRPLRRFVNVFVADDDVRFLDGLDTKVPAGRPSRSSRPSPAADPHPGPPAPMGRAAHFCLNREVGRSSRSTSIGGRTIRSPCRSWRAVARSGPGDAPGATTPPHGLRLARQMVGLRPARARPGGARRPGARGTRGLHRVAIAPGRCFAISSLNTRVLTNLSRVPEPRRT